jgi:sugar-specific transcriptional regulator TrmB
MVVNQKDMTPPEIVKQLLDCGLTKNQAEIYVCLVANGELRIQDITDITHIPRSSIYESLKGLLTNGLIVNVIEHKFVKLKACPIGNLRHRFNEDEAKLKSSLKSVDELELLLKAFPNTQVNSTTSVRYFKGLSGGRQLFWNTLQTRSPVLVYSEYGRSKFLGKNFYADFVQKSNQIGIKEQVLINPTDRAIGLIKKDTQTSLARTKIKNLRFLDETNLNIKGETFIYDAIFAQITLDGEVIQGFEIESKNFAQMQKSNFQTLWKHAKPLTKHY